MATRIPLIVNSLANQIQELPVGDSLTGINSITATSFYGSLTGNITSSGISTFNTVGISTTNPTSTLHVIGNANIVGILSDINGNVHRYSQNSQSSAYVLDISDVGKHIGISTGGITVPQNVFTIGDEILVYNNSAFNQTITQGTGVTLRLAGSASTGNRTLAQYGLATILCVGTNTFVISGGGVS